jgi:hypothetical protein
MLTLGNLTGTVLTGTNLTQEQAQDWVLSTALALVAQALVLEPLKIVALGFYWVARKGSLIK